MDKEDARKQTLAQLHERRKQVVRLYNKGHKVMNIVEMTGLTYPTVRNTIDLFTQGGWSAIRPTPRGRTKGEGRVLTPEQEKQIQRVIIDHRPEQLKMDFCLWSRAAVMQLIEQDYGIKLPVRTVGKYLKRWGFTPQKPIKKAYEQRPEAVKAWLDEYYPAIAAQAKTEGGEIHWGDETVLTNTSGTGRHYVSFSSGWRRPTISEKPGA
jgi:transposase